MYKHIFSGGKVLECSERTTFQILKTDSIHGVIISFTEAKKGMLNVKIILNQALPVNSVSVHLT